MFKTMFGLLKKKEEPPKHTPKPVQKALPAPPPKPVNKRRHERIIFDTSFIVKEWFDVTAAVLCRGKTVNLTEGGAKIMLTEPLGKNKTIPRLLPGETMFLVFDSLCNEWGDKIMLQFEIKSIDYSAPDTYGVAFILNDKRKTDVVKNAVIKEQEKNKTPE